MTAQLLPQVTKPLIIDGATQPGFSGSPVVELRSAGGSYALKPASGANSFSPARIFVEALTSSVAELNFTQFAPTAAAVGISGRVMTESGRGVSKAMLTLTGANGETRVSVTNPFGYYRFVDVEAGQTYVAAVSSKQYQFQPRVILVLDEMENVDFMQLE